MAVVISIDKKNSLKKLFFYVKAYTLYPSNAQNIKLKMIL